MFEEFRSNLLLLLHSRYPEGMLLNNLEPEYDKYFNQTLKPGMLSVGAMSWVEVVAETSLKHDTTLWEDESVIYIKCIVSRSEWEMMIIAKLAKYSHFKFAKSSFFQLQDCSCCPPPNHNQPVEDSSHSFQPKDVEMEEDEHLDRGCFMGIIAPSDDDLTKSDFIDPKFLSSCENYSIDTENRILTSDNLDIKREVASPIEPENNYVNDYLLTSQHLVLQPDFMDMEDIKLENESFMPFDDNGTHKGNYSTSHQEGPNFVESATNTDKEPTKKTFRSSDPNYVPDSEEDSEDIEDDSNDESNPSLPISTQANKNGTNNIRRKRFLSSGKPGKFSCKWQSCLKNFTSQTEFRDHIISHGVMINKDNPLSAEKAMSIALCQSSGVVSNDKANSTDQSNNVTQNQSKLSVVLENKELSLNNCDSSTTNPYIPKPTKAKGKEKEIIRGKGKGKESVGAGNKGESFHCTTLGCNRSFSVYSKLATHQRRCGAISDFSCRWPECARLFQSSLDLHNHVKMDHRKVQGTESPANLQMIEKTIVLTCRIQSCGYSFRCRDKLEEHEKQCALVRKKPRPVNSKEVTEQSKVENTSGTLKAKGTTPCPSTSSTRGPITQTLSGANIKPQPKGFARMTKYEAK